MIIRDALPTDAAVLADFNLRMAHETEALRLDAGIVRAGVTALIENPHRGFYLVAEVDECTVGMLMVTTEWSDWHNGVYWWIQSVYVHPEHRRQGVYRELYRNVKRRASAASGVRSFRLYVERDNDRAQQTYGKLGMAETPYRVFEELTDSHTPESQHGESGP